MISSGFVFDCIAILPGIVRDRAVIPFLLFDAILLLYTPKVDSIMSEEALYSLPVGMVSRISEREEDISLYSLLSLSLPESAFSFN